MAGSSALSASSKLLNLNTPALQNLISRHLIRPSASAAGNLFQSTTVQEFRSLNLFQIDEIGRDTLNNSSNPRNLNLWECNLQRPINSSVTQIELARTKVRNGAEDGYYNEKDDDEDEEEDDDDDDDDDYDDDDDEDCCGSGCDDDEDN